MGSVITQEQKHEEMLRRIKGFRLLDDDFMTKCFEENPEATELVLRIVLNIFMRLTARAGNPIIDREPAFLFSIEEASVDSETITIH